MKFKFNFDSTNNTPYRKWLDTGLDTELDTGLDTGAHLLIDTPDYCVVWTEASDWWAIRTKVMEW